MGELEGATEAMAWVFGLAVPQRTSPVVQFVLRVHAALARSPLAGGHPELAEKMKVFVGAHLSGNVALARLGSLRPQACAPEPGHTMWPVLPSEAQQGWRLAGDPPAVG